MLRNLPRFWFVALCFLSYFQVISYMLQTPIIQASCLYSYKLTACPPTLSEALKSRGLKPEDYWDSERSRKSFTEIISKPEMAWSWGWDYAFSSLASIKVEAIGRRSGEDVIGSRGALGRFGVSILPNVVSLFTFFLFGTG